MSNPVKNWKTARALLTVEVSPEDFEAALNKAYLKMRGKISMPGFRPGKAPRKMIEKHVRRRGLL